jgi:Fungal chitosanase of glycosyl hydrolase group 75
MQPPAIPTSPSDKAENAVEKKSPTVLDQIEQVAKISATVALPLIVAIGGWIIQTAIEDDKQRAAQIQADQQSALDQQRVSLEYVKIAMGILTSENAKIPKELTRWSWLLLNDQSPKKFDPEDLKKLIERDDRIPAPSTSTFPNVNLAYFESGMSIVADGWPGGPGGYPDWQPQTSLKQPDSNESLDASKIPYIVLPGPRPRLDAYGISLGDFAAVYNKANGKLAFAIFADIGPSRRAGEGSIALANELGIDSGPRSQGAKEGIIYVVFPNSRTKVRITPELIKAEGGKLYEKWGGRAELQRRLQAPG